MLALQKVNATPGVCMAFFHSVATLDACITSDEGDKLYSSDFGLAKVHWTTPTGMFDRLRAQMIFQ